MKKQAGPDAWSMPWQILRGPTGGYRVVRVPSYQAGEQPSPSAAPLLDALPEATMATTGLAAGALAAEPRGEPLIDRFRGAMRGLAVGGGAAAGLHAMRSPEGEIPLYQGLGAAALGGMGGYLVSEPVLRWLGIDRPDTRSPSQKEHDKRYGAPLSSVVGARPSILADLMRAKVESDRRNYGVKHEILRKAFRSRPDEFEIDSREGPFSGVTHRPTGFRFHVPNDLLSRDIRDATREETKK